jgi:hypothetical protein
VAAAQQRAVVKVVVVVEVIVEIKRRLLSVATVVRYPAVMPAVALKVARSVMIVVNSRVHPAVVLSMWTTRIPISVRTVAR